MAMPAWRRIVESLAKSALPVVKGNPCPATSRDFNHDRT
jgi:hypothetical protein